MNTQDIAYTVEIFVIAFSCVAIFFAFKKKGNA